MIALDIETAGILPGGERSLRRDIAMDTVLRDVDPAREVVENVADRYLALSWPLARVVSVGMRVTGCVRNPAADGDCIIVDGSLVDMPENAHVALSRGMRCAVIEAESEAQLLVEAARILSAPWPSPLVTFNGARFDLPTLVARMVAHSIKPPRLILDALRQKPWESGVHVDLMSLFGHGNTRGVGSLRAWAVGLLGIDPKADGDGAHVGELIERRDGAALARYNLGDARITAALYQRWMEVMA